MRACGAARGKKILSSIILVLDSREPHADARGMGVNDMRLIELNIYTDKIDEIVVFEIV